MLKREYEWTFVVPEDLAHSLANALGKLGNLTLRGHELRLMRTRSRLGLYFYIETTHPGRTDRLIFRARDGLFDGRLSTKVWSNDPQDQAKYEGVTLKGFTMDAWASFLRNGSRVTSALLKAQHRLTFQGSGSGWAQISFDSMAPFRPGEDLMWGDTFRHVEIEARSADEPGELLALLAARNDIWHSFARLRESKRSIAAKLWPKPLQLRFATGDALGSFLSCVVDSRPPTLRVP